MERSPSIVFPSEISPSEESLLARISELEAKRKELSKNANFLEAEKLHRQILSLKTEIRNQQKSALHKKQLNEFEINSTYETEFLLLTEDWDMRMKEFDNEWTSGRSSMIERHEEQLKQAREHLERTISIHPKHSTEYLSLKRSQDTLAKKHNYIEAHKVHQRMEEEEKKNWTRKRAQKIENNLNNLRKGLDAELSSYDLKVKVGYEELNKQKAFEFEALIKKYQNSLLGLENIQKLEKHKFEGKHTTGAGWASFNVAGSSRIVNNARNSVTPRVRSSIGVRRVYTPNPTTTKV